MQRRCEACAADPAPFRSLKLLLLPTDFPVLICARACAAALSSPPPPPLPPPTPCSCRPIPLPSSSLNCHPPPPATTARPATHLTSFSK